MLRLLADGSGDLKEKVVSADEEADDEEEEDEAEEEDADAYGVTALAASYSLS